MNSDNTIDLVKLALDSCLMRQTAFANNMANINTEGYQPVSVNFEQQLAQASELNGSNLAMVKPFYQVEEMTLSPDTIMSQSIKNMTHYRALIKGLNQSLSIMKIALHGNS